MAKVIKHTGEVIEEVLPLNGRDFKLEELYQHVGCEFVQMVRIENGWQMWLDEEGKFNQPNNYNREATILLQEAGGLPGDYIAGDVFICEGDEVL